jgi:DNA-binding response OmpR family regulator
MTGLDLCKAIRKILTHQYSLTARDTVHETIEGIKAGANDYIKTV